MRVSEKHADYCIYVFIINEGDKFRQQIDLMQAYSNDIHSFRSDVYHELVSWNEDELRTVVRKYIPYYNQRR